MPGIHSYSLAVLRMAYEVKERASRVAAAAPDGTADDPLVAIILAASAAEGFVNDLMGMVQFLAAIPGTPSTGDVVRLTEIAKAVEFMETERCRTQAKYLTIALLTSSDRIRSGREPFQSLDDLCALRNGVVHVKPVDPEERSRLTKIAEALVQRGIARTAVPRSPNRLNVETWWTQIRTPQVAAWAVETARMAMLALAESVASVGDVSKFVAGTALILQRKPATAEVSVPGSLVDSVSAVAQFPEAH